MGSLESAMLRVFPSQRSSVATNENRCDQRLLDSLPLVWLGIPEEGVCLQGGHSSQDDQSRAVVLIHIHPCVSV